MVKMKMMIISISAVVLIFAITISLSILNNEDKSLDFKQGVNLKAKRVDYYKGIVLLEDSIAVSGNCPIIKSSNYGIGGEVDYSSTLGNLSGPYQFIKQANSDIIKIVIQGDTTYYQYLSLD